MKIIKTETYNKLIEAYAPKYSAMTYKEYSERLEKELAEAKNLKSILEKITSMTINGLDFSATGGCFTSGYNLPDTVLQYTDDILGGKVIKQEGTKCLVIDKNGDVKIGLTKQKADKGYRYKLIRN